MHGHAPMHVVLVVVLVAVSNPAEQEASPRNWRGTGFGNRQEAREECVGQGWVEMCRHPHFSHWS